MYGVNARPSWEEIAGSPQVRDGVVKAGPTMIAFAPYPPDRGRRDDDWTKLVLQPLERNRGTSNEVRWLAVIESNVAVFGTIASVQQELDRHLDHSAADLSLRQRLARLRRDDETWCVLAAFVHNYETRRALGSLMRVSLTRHTMATHSNLESTMEGALNSNTK